MRKIRWQSIIGGVFFIILALGFYFYMLSLVPRSFDPVALMQITGQVSGVVSGLGIVLIILGLIGKKS